MTLPEPSTARIRNAFTSESLLDVDASEEVIKAFAHNKEINWNLILTKQFEIEQKDSDEAGT